MTPLQRWLDRWPPGTIVLETSLNVAWQKFSKENDSEAIENAYHPGAYRELWHSPANPDGVTSGTLAYWVEEGVVMGYELLYTPEKESVKG
jgi:hypothetical protein